MQPEENKVPENPNPDKPIQTPAADVAPEKPAKRGKMKVSKFQSIVNTITLVLVCLVIGALVILLALYLPALNKLNKAQSEVTRLSTIEVQYNEQQTNLTKAKEQASVYKTISDTSLLEVALTGNDTTKANQQLRYVEEDLKGMQIPEFPEILQRLQSQFMKIKTSASSSSSQALIDLGEFYKDLLLLADNLK
jgi:hypothetical protein